MKIICVGSSRSGKGKTTVCEALLRHLEGFCALKVTTIREKDPCPREEVCGICDENLNGYAIEEDPLILHAQGKDTWRYWRAGASRVRWLRSSPDSLGEALKHVFEDFAACTGVIVEGNMPMVYLKNALSIMIIDPDDEIKKSALAIMPTASIILCEKEKVLKLKHLPVGKAARILPISLDGVFDQDDLVSTVRAALEITTCT
jgi:molybdopterin-guanine dinucleotide biosynthesis protein